MMRKILPWQMCPSPINLALQEQLNDPAVFVQVALSMSELESTHRAHDHDYEHLS